MTTRTKSGGLLTELILEVFRLNGSLLAAGNRLAEPESLTSARWQVMGAIDLEEQALTVAQIARRMGLVRQGVRRIVNELERDGFLTLTDNADHKRASLVCLSEKGRRALKKVDQAQIEWVNGLTSGLTQKQITEAKKLLRIVRERCDQNPE